MTRPDSWRVLSLEELAEYQGLTSHFAAVAGFATSGISIASNGEGANAESGTATFVTPNYFDVLGVRPIIGAGLPRTEDASARTQPIAVIAYAVWEKFFARSPSVLGATLTVDGVPVTIVGVAPPRFAGLTRFNAMTIWMPIASRPLIVPQLQPGTEIVIERKDPYGGPVWVKVGKKRHAVGTELTTKVYVSKVQP